AQSIWLNIFPSGGFQGFKPWGLVIAIAEVICLVGMLMIIIWMSDAERRIPIQYAKRVVGRKMYGGQNTNLPLKVNMAGVMPIIFANSIVAIPATIASFMNAENGFVKFINKWFNYNTFPYLIVFLILMLLFAFFYIAISFNPVEVANNIKNNGGAVPGIRSGQPTVEYIQKILNRVTLLGAIILAFIACFPMLVNIIDTMITPNSQRFAALSFSGSSMIIVVGVALETVRELEAQMSLRNYKGFLD
ncbi:MAG: preprotein translocase subunit SecY, partial [Ruminococcaceae bacterium]|nr:preprotein translocase subunit SecY [Oscillospiraceae bacterium]